MLNDTNTETVNTVCSSHFFLQNVDNSISINEGDPAWSLRLFIWIHRVKVRDRRWKYAAELELQHVRTADLHVWIMRSPRWSCGVRLIPAIQSFDQAIPQCDTAVFLIESCGCRLIRRMQSRGVQGWVAREYDMATIYYSSYIKLNLKHILQSSIHAIPHASFSCSTHETLKHILPSINNKITCEERPLLLYNQQSMQSIRRSMSNSPSCK